MTLFTHLKIILLQCFQFSAISGIQTGVFISGSVMFRKMIFVLIFLGNKLVFIIKFSRKHIINLLFKYFVVVGFV